MAGASSLEAVKRKIKFLQEQADVAEERSERLQKELLAQRTAREKVSGLVPDSQTGAAYQELHTSLSRNRSFSALEKKQQQPPFERQLAG